MGIVSSLHLLLLLLLHFLSFTASSLDYTNHTRKVGSLRLSRIQRNLGKMINKPPLLTTESPDGEINDCVHKRIQPALDQPLLHNHRIQVTKNEDLGNQATDLSQAKLLKVFFFLGERCPKGTVPIRRSTVEDVVRARSLYDFGNKQFVTTRRPVIRNGNG